MLKFKSLFIILLPFMVSILNGEVYRKEYHESFDVQDGMQLRLNHGDGDVTINPWDQDVVKIDIIYHADHSGISGVRNDLFAVDFEKTGEVLHVVSQEKNTGNLGISSRKIIQYTYQIQAPEYLVLDLKGDDGNITVKHWRNNIECSLNDGNIYLTDIMSDEVYLRAEDGDIDIKKLSGKLYVWEEDGDLKIEELKSDQCSIEIEDGTCTIDEGYGNFTIRYNDGDVRMYGIKTQKTDIRGDDGDIEFELLKSENVDIYLQSKDGSTRLRMDPAISAELSIETNHGRINTRLSNETKAKEGKNWYKANLQDAQGKIIIRTHDGSVKVSDL